MAVVACPGCKKKFKPKGDVQGKKIKCPFCKAPFVVPGGKADKQVKGKPPAKKPDDDKELTPEEKAAADAQAAEQAKEDYDAQFDDKSAYEAQHVELVPRCPNCTAEMGPHDIICLECGYNTLTREWGKTQVTMGLTLGRHLKYLAPALGSVAFVLASIVGLLYYTILSPYDAGGTMFEFTNHESIRMWTTVIVLGWLFGAGTYCIKMFIEKPKPDELEVEEKEE